MMAFKLFWVVSCIYIALGSLVSGNGEDIDIATLVIQLVGDVGRIKGDIDNIRGTLNKQDTKIETLDKQDMKLEGRVDGISRDLDVEKKEMEKRVTETALADKMKEIHQEISDEGTKIGTLNKDLDQLKAKGLVDELFPVGSIHITFANMSPPKQGQYGIQWQLLPEGYALMTASSANTGKHSGSQRLDVGYTNGHALTVTEMPSHSHTYRATWRQAITYRSGSSANTYGERVTTESSSTIGGNRAHNHKVDILNHKVMVWRRIK